MFVELAVGLVTEVQRQKGHKREVSREWGWGLVHFGRSCFPSQGVRRVIKRELVRRYAVCP